MTTEGLTIINRSVFQKFVGVGYLPEVLPPIFTSMPFAEHCMNGAIQIDTAKAKSLDRISYSCTKRGHTRRIFDIMHPASVAYSSAWLSAHWDQVQAFCNAPQTTATELTLSDDLSSRAIKTASFDTVQHAAKICTARAKYIIRADIAKFYPSIYTHSIPWALHGKANAKARTDQANKEIYANKLDWALRLGQSGQTKGVPIGADISRVAAEIIGSAVDRIVREKCDPRIIGYVRNIDDFSIGCKTLADAESILSALSVALREFELSLNDEKTQIINAHDFYDDDWAIELDAYLGTNSGDRRRVIARAFDRTFLYASKNRADSAVKFLVRTIDKEIAAGLLEFEDVEHDLIRAFVNFPHCTDYVMTLLMVQAARGEPYDRKEWETSVNEELVRHASTNHDHEVCWLLSTSYMCGFKIAETEALSVISNPLSACLMYILAEKGLLDVDLNSIFLARINDQGSQSNWLLVHEGINRDWFKSSEVNFDCLASLESLLPDDLTFLNDDLVSEFSKKSGKARSIPDRYMRYDEPLDEGYIEYLIKKPLNPEPF